MWKPLGVIVSLEGLEGKVMFGNLRDGNFDLASGGSPYSIVFIHMGANGGGFAASTSKLTVNLGLRFDLDHGAQGEWVQFLPWLSGKRPTDKNNFGPRTGFAYQVNDKTVVRGGWGVFFTQLEDDALHQSTVLLLTTNVLVPNNGRPDFALNPFGGPKPTYAQANAQACDVLGRSINPATNGGCYVLCWPVSSR